MEQRLEFAADAPVVDSTDRRIAAAGSLVDVGGAEVAARPPIPQVDIGLYAPAGELGRGAFGRVELYALRPGAEVPPGTPSTIAVKSVMVQAGELANPRSRVRREIENTMALPDHPNICKTYGWLPDEHEATVVRIYMEHVDGHDMLRWAKASKGCDEPTLWGIFRQILAGVLHCHAHSICHRDLKAENVVILPDNTCKLVDFGLSKNVAGSAARSLVGTSAYLPPEIAQADGRTPYDPFKGDAWSLGVVLYVISCGEYPFGCDGPSGEPHATVLERISNGTWANPGTMKFGGRLLSSKLEQRSRTLQGLICRLLTTDPEDRLSLQHVCEQPWFYERGVPVEHLAAATGGAELGTAGLSAHQLAELGLERPLSSWEEVIHDLPFDSSMAEAVEMALMCVGESEEMNLPEGVSLAIEPEPEQLMQWQLPALPSMATDGSWAEDCPPAQSWITSQAFGAARAAKKPVPHLPKSKTGKPKPVAPWIAGAIYWIADQEYLQAITGLSVTPALPPGRPAEFVLKKGAGDGVASWLRHILKGCQNSGLKLQGWEAVSKHMRGDKPNPPLESGADQLEPAKRKKWWEDCYRGGNILGDHSRVFVELVPELFLMQTILLETERPGLLRAATDEWLTRHGKKPFSATTLKLPAADANGHYSAEVQDGVAAPMEQGARWTVAAPETVLPRSDQTETVAPEVRPGRPSTPPPVGS